jgi:hypothetical protein
MEPKTFSDNLTASIPADFDFCEFEMTFKNNVDGDWVEQRASLLPCLQQMLVLDKQIYKIHVYRRLINPAHGKFSGAIFDQNIDSLIFFYNLTHVNKTKLKHYWCM